MKFSHLANSNTILSHSAHCNHMTQQVKHQTIVMRMTPLLCAVMWWCTPKTNPEAAAQTHPSQTHTDCHIPLPAAEEKTSLALREFALWGLHTRRSWELLWHNSCSLILPPHSSVGHTVQYSLSPHRRDAVCMLWVFWGFFCLTCEWMCVHYVGEANECRCETVIREREKGIHTKKAEKHTGGQKMSRPPHLSQEVIPLLSGFFPGSMFD